MNKQDLMDWINSTDEILGERFNDIVKYNAVYPTIIKNILAQQIEFENIMNEAYKKLEEL